MKIEQLIAEIDDLPVAQRAKIAEHILQGLNTPDPQIEDQWIAEAQRRMKEYKAGEIEMIPGKEFLESLKSITG